MLVYSFFAILAAVQIASSADVVEEVDCPDLQKACSCSVGATACKFTLKISRIQPFTSYKLGPDGELLTDSIGAPYILDSTTGFRSALRRVNRSCIFGDEVSLLADEDFIRRGCSPPITVDGESMRDTIVINGITPGPTLVVDSGATVMMRVVNGRSLGEDTSMHWHGMYQRRTAWMDGVGQVTEPSIEPGTSFDYIFKAQPRGTHWYHSHVGLQRVNGMYAAMVVRGPALNSSELIPEENGNANIIDEPGIFTITLTDWSDMSALDVFFRARVMGFTPATTPLERLTMQGVLSGIVRTVRADGSDTGPVPFFSGLINGRGRYRDTITPLTVFEVQGGTYILFRVVGAIETRVQMVSIDGHTLRVIATDGKDIEFVDVDIINVEAGERYDFIVNASSPVPGNFWIRAETQEVNTPNGEEHSARAILSYQGAPSLDWRNGYTNVLEAQRNCTPQSPCVILNCPYESRPGMNCVSLLELVPRPRKPLEDLPKFPPSVDCLDCMHFLNFGFDGPGPVHSVNARTLELPTIAYQTTCGQFDEDNSTNSTANTCDKNCAEGTSCQCIHVIPVANQRVYKDDVVNGELESIVMVFSALTSTSTHPIHMHGHAFQVMYIGYGTFDENGTLIPTTDMECDSPCTKPQWTNDVVPEGVMNRTVGGKVTPNAIQKDTVVIPAGGYVVVAIKADNPGYWYIHCHIEGHTHGGMVVIMQEYPPIQQWLPPPGIEDPEDGFTWSVEEFNTHLENALTCAAAPETTQVSPTTSDEEITISRAGFGIALAILILLAILCIILLILLIVVCIMNKNKPEKGFDKVELSAK